MLLCNTYKVSVWDDDQVLEMHSGDSYIRLPLNFIPNND